MLTKDLIRYRIRKGRLNPLFIDPDDADLREQAEAMIYVFNEGVGGTRAALEEACAQLIETSEVEAVVSRGLEKLLLDRTDFTTPEDEERPAFRARVFAAANEVMTRDDLEDEAAFAKAMQGALDREADQIRAQMFNDLPMYHPIESFREITPVRLLHRYNIATIQWLLLNTEDVTVSLPETTPAKLRQVLKYLRFQQLMADITREGKTFHLKVSGALSIFFQTRKYGMNLANFFPALLHQPRWRLRARVSPRKGIFGDLDLDETCGLVPETERFHGYVPPEIKDLSTRLADKLPGWKVKPGAGFVPLPGDQYCFPDLSLAHESGREVAIEMFHPWHSGPLLARLAQLEDVTEVPLLIGVHRRLTKQDLVASALGDSRYYDQHGFTFSDIPAVRQVLPLLEALV